jgi:hypothetical protein
MAVGTGRPPPDACLSYYAAAWGTDAGCSHGVQCRPRRHGGHGALAFAGEVVVAVVKGY